MSSGALGHIVWVRTDERGRVSEEQKAIQGRGQGAGGGLDAHENERSQECSGNREGPKAWCV